MLYDLKCCNMCFWLPSKLCTKAWQYVLWKVWILIRLFLWFLYEDSHCFFNIRFSSSSNSSFFCIFLISAIVIVSVSEILTWVYFLIHLCSVELLIPYSLHIWGMLFPELYRLTMLCLNSSLYLVFSMLFSPFYDYTPFRPFVS